MMTHALQALVSAAALTGFQPAVPPVPAGTSARVVSAAAAIVQTEPQEVLRIPLAEIRAQQAGAWASAPVAGGSVAVAVGFDSEARLWGKFRAAAAAAFNLETLSRGVTQDLGFGPVGLLFQAGNFHLFSPAAPERDRVQLPVGELVELLYENAVHVQLPLVRYAVIYEEGDTVPPALCLLRVGRDGGLWITYKTHEEMSRVQWVVSVDGVHYGMRLDGADLVWVAKAPSSQETLSLGERPLPYRIPNR